MEQQQKKMAQPEKYYLWWMDKETKQRISAGVAFYEEEYGEYRLKIDLLSAIMEKAGQFFLRSVGASGERVEYVVEAPFKKNGKFAGRLRVGEGYLSKETDGEVFVDFGPFEKTLVVTLH